MEINKIYGNEDWYRTITKRNGLQYHNNIKAGSKNEAITKALREFTDYANRNGIDYSPSRGDVSLEKIPKLLF